MTTKPPTSKYDKRLNDLNVFSNYINNLNATITKQELNLSQHSNNNSHSNQYQSHDQGHDQGNIHYENVKGNVNNREDIYNPKGEDVLNERSYINNNNNDFVQRNNNNYNNNINQSDDKFSQDKIEREYSRVNNNLEAVNERLKLNEISKNYLLNKMNNQHELIQQRPIKK